MTGTAGLRRLLSDSVPAAVVVVVTAVLMSSQVGELDGKAGLLAVAGLIGIGLSSLLLRGPEAEASGRSVAVVPAVAFAPPVVAAPSTPGPVHVAGAQLKSLESFSVAKEGAADDENEDSFAVNPTTGTIAVADGASSSFGARVWSSALVEAAIVDKSSLAPAFVANVMRPAAARWRQHHEAGGELPWWAVEGLRRGGFATLLAVRIGSGPEGRAWQALAVGDSCVFHLRQIDSGWMLRRAFPLATAEAFGSHPVLLSSVAPAPTEGIELAGGELTPGDVLIAATDAVSEWLLGDASRLAFAATAPISDINDAVRAARRDRSMVNDDATFVRFIEGGRDGS